MRFAVINEGRVVNHAVAEEDFATACGWIPAGDSEIGDLWDGVTFTKPVVQVDVPASVTMRQARLALLSAGILDDIDTAIAGLPSPDKEQAKIEWEYSQEVQRHNSFVSVLASALGMSNKQIDDLFILAKNL